MIDSKNSESVVSEDAPSSSDVESSKFQSESSDWKVLPFVGFFIIIYEEWKKKIDQWMGREVTTEDVEVKVEEEADEDEDEKEEEDDDEKEVEGVELSVKEASNKEQEL